jgi:hypothetical protein
MRFFYLFGDDYDVTMPHEMWTFGRAPDAIHLLQNLQLVGVADPSGD